MSNWFVFHVETGKEDVACDFLNKLLNSQESIAFIPQVETIYKNSKFIRKYLKPMFPGYVFTDSIVEEITFITQTYKLTRFSKCIFKLLGNDNLNYMKLSEDEKNFLLGFCDEEYIIEESMGFIKGDKVFVTSGPLQGRESVIKRIDRHKRIAEIELEFMGDVRRAKVALEIVSKV